MKRCSKCKIEKDENCFSKSRGGLRSECKACVKIRSAIYYLDNKEKINKNTQKYWNENKETLNDWQKRYYSEHKDEKLEYCVINRERIAESRRIRENEKLKTDTMFKLRKNIATSIRHFIRSGGKNKGGASITNYLPYSLEELKQHLEQQFEPWMTWNNWGKYDAKAWNDNDPTTWTWQIDHIVPHSSFVYLSMSDEDFQKCWALSNLRPLSSKQNLLDGITRIRHGK